MVQWKARLPKILSAIQGYGLAVLVHRRRRLARRFLGERLGVHDVELPIFLFAHRLNRPGMEELGLQFLALVLSCLIFAYYFVEPLYTFGHLARKRSLISSSLLRSGVLVMWFGPPSDVALRGTFVKLATTWKIGSGGAKSAG